MTQLARQVAGGDMAAVLLRVRDELRATHRSAGANLVFGVYDWHRSPTQRGIRPHESPDVLGPDAIRFFTDCYLPGHADVERRDPAISTAFADPRGLPPALPSVGTTYHLLDGTLLLASRWAAAGNEVELFVASDMPHGFPCTIAATPLVRLGTSTGTGPEFKPQHLTPPAVVTAQVRDRGRRPRRPAGGPPRFPLTVRGALRTLRVFRGTVSGRRDVGPARARYKRVSIAPIRSRPITPAGGNPCASTEPVKGPSRRSSGRFFRPHWS